MVFRALERAGNRLKAKGAVVPPGVAAADLYMSVPPISSAIADDLLFDAWSCTDRFCGGADPALLAAALDGYTRTLLTMRTAHDAQVLRGYMQQVLQPALEAV
jgi:hypothetical protein